MRITNAWNRLLSMALWLGIILSLLLCFPMMASAAGTEGKITIELSDLYGDGWSDNAIEIYADGELLDIATMDDGESTTWTATLNPHMTYEFRWVKGTYAQETSFVIYVGTQEEVSASGSEYIDGETIVVLEKSCSGTNYVSGVCADCGAACLHRYVGKDGNCTVCGYTCPAHNWSDGVCSVCFGTCLHQRYDVGVCLVCGKSKVLSIEMQDVYSDGWSDNAIEIYADGELVDTVTIDNGLAGSWSADYDATATYTFAWVVGSYANECSFRILLNGTVLYEATTQDCGSLVEGVFFTLEPWCDHGIYDRDYCCARCGEPCPHTGLTPGGTCDVCGFTCGTSATHTWEQGACTTCGLACGHEHWSNCVCDTCGFICGADQAHSFDENHKCGICGFVCGTSAKHVWENDTCTVCGMACQHGNWTDFVCGTCGFACGVDRTHSFDDNHKCGICGFTCGVTAEHAWSNGICSVCGLSCEHPAYANGICGICGYCQSAVQNGVGDNGFALYEIHNAGQLLWFADYVNRNEVLSTKIVQDADAGEPFGFEYTSGCVNGKLMADIDMGGLNWTPIGVPYVSVYATSRNAYGYAGVFDGNGHTVSGIDCVVETNDHMVYAGFFGAIGGGTVKNLTVMGNVQAIANTVYYPAAYAGGIAGYICEWFDYAEETAESRQDVSSGIVNCTFIGNVSVNAMDQEYAGGIVGIASGTSITNCLSAATVSVTETGAYSVGSLCGYIMNECKITNCWYDSSLCTLGEVNGEDHDEVNGLPTERMALGSVAHKLGFGQTLGVDTYPSYGDDPVYQITTGCCTYANTQPAAVTQKEHNGGPACTEQPVCKDCGIIYGEIVGHSYVDGICTACGVADPDYVKPIVKPNLALSYPTLNFKDVVYYNVYYQVSDMTDVVEMGLITFDGALSTGTIDDAAEVITGYIASGSNYMVHTNGINAKNLGDALYFKVYAKLSDGSYVYSDLAGYHAVAYAKDILANSTNAKMKSLVVAMLNYGAAAQVQFEYKTDSLMNSFLTAEQKALVSEYSADMVAPVTKVDSSKIGSFAYVSGGYSALYPSVSFEGAFSVKFYFTPAKAMDGNLTMYYWSAADYAAADILTADNATGVFTMDAISGTYVATVEGIAARQIDETIYVAGIYESNGVSYPTGVIAYSLGTYCLDRVANGTGNMPAFAKATIVYGYYAKAYFA